MKQRGKATREQLKRHNRRLILRAIYEELADNRAALALETGLAKPTVSDIVSELIERGFIEEGGHGSSTTSGGKRPRLLRFVPTARQVIGVTIDTSEIVGCLANCDGRIVAQHHIQIEEARDSTLLTLLEYAINALIAQMDAPLLCVSVGVPGIVNNVRGVVKSSPLLGWHNLALTEHLSARYNAPAYVSNNTELAARAQIAYNTGKEPQNLVTVLVNHAVEVGIAFDGGMHHHGSEINTLCLATAASRRVEFLSWSHVEARLREVRTQHKSSLLAEHPTYLHIRHAVHEQDRAALILQNEIAVVLAEIYAWIIGLIRPDEIALAGSISDLGEPLINLIRQQIMELLPDDAVEPVTLSLARGKNLSILGAVANALQKELGIL